MSFFFFFLGGVSALKNMLYLLVFSALKNIFVFLVVLFLSTSCVVLLVSSSCFGLCCFTLSVYVFFFGGLLFCSVSFCFCSYFYGF